MFCPECEVEYRDGFERCSDCDVPLVESLDAPKELAEPDEPDHYENPLLPLAAESSPDVVDELVYRFEKEGVAYVIESGTALELYDRVIEGNFEPRPWSARIYIAAPYKERAQEILAQIQADLRRH